MKYKDLVDEILEYADDVEHLHEVMDLVIGKAINQERIQIYKTLAIYFSELTEKNKAYLVKKIETNQVILDERIQKLDSNDIFTNTNDFFDLKEGMEQIRIDKNLMKNHGTVVFDEAGGLEGERPPTRNGTFTVPTAREGTYAYQITTTAATPLETVAAARAYYTNERVVAVPQPVNPNVNVIMDTGATLEARIQATLAELDIEPPTDWLEDLDEEFGEDEQE